MRWCFRIQNKQVRPHHVLAISHVWEKPVTRLGSRGGRFRTNVVSSLWPSRLEPLQGLQAAPIPKPKGLNDSYVCRFDSVVLGILLCGVYCLLLWLFCGVCCLLLWRNRNIVADRCTCMKSSVLFCNNWSELFIFNPFRESIVNCG